MEVEIRSANEATISGYVNVVERRSRVLRRIGAPPFREIVREGTFRKALDKGGTVGLMLNHERRLCDTNSGLELREDNVGLYAKAAVTDAETVQAAKDGKLTGWSFGFRCLKDSWNSEDGVEIRTLDDIDLNEVSILTKTPAYTATSVEVRDDEPMKEQRSFAEEMNIIDRTSAKPQAVDFSLEEAELEILSMKG